MDKSSEYDANLVAALCMAIAGRLRTATERAADHTCSAPAALAAVLTQHEGEPVGALVRSLGVAHSTAVRLVDRLEEAGFVERRPGVHGRSVSLVLTPEGRLVGQEILGSRQRATEDALEVLTATERHTFVVLCEKVLAGLGDSQWDGYGICCRCNFEACGHAEGRGPVDQAVTHAEAYAWL